MNIPFRSVRRSQNRNTYTDRPWQGHHRWLRVSFLLTLFVACSGLSHANDFFFGKNVNGAARDQLRANYGGSFYRVSVKPANSSNWSEVFVYQNRNPRQNFRDTSNGNHWASFDMSGSFDVRVETVVGNIDNGFKVKPSSDRVNATRRSAKRIEFRLSKPGQYWVDVPNKDRDPLFIFANPREAAAPSGSNVVRINPGANYRRIFADAKARPDNQKVTLYFNPGVHQVGDTKEVLKDRNFEIYLPYGSAFVGTIEEDNMVDFTLRGRGIYDGGGPWTRWNAGGGSYAKPKNIDNPGSVHRNITSIRGGANAKMSGLVMISTRGFMVRCFANDSRYQNLKIMGWYANTDGFSIFRNSEVRDSFMKVNDDGFSVASGKVLNCVIWHGYNVHPIVTRTFSGNQTIENVLIKDIDIIKVEPGDGAVFAFRGNLENSRYQNFTFENINIETDVNRFFDLAPSREYWPDGSLEPQNSSKQPTILRSFVFKNLNYTGTARRDSRWRCGNRGEISNITFENCRANGNLLKNINSFSAANGFKALYGYGRIRDIRFKYSGRTFVNRNPSNDIGGFLIRTGSAGGGDIPFFAIDGEYPSTVYSVRGTPLPASGSIPSGYTTLQNLNSGQCLDLPFGSSKRGTSIKQWTCNNSENRQVRFERRGSSEFYNIRLRGSGQCIDIKNGGTTDGTDIQQWSCSGSINRSFKVVPKGNGYFTLEAELSGACMEVEDFSKERGANIRMWRCTARNNQRFRFR